MNLMYLIILIPLMTSQALAGTPYNPNDLVEMTSNKAMIGPEGVRTSCIDIARFEYGNRLASSEVRGHSEVRGQVLQRSTGSGLALQH